MNNESNKIFCSNCGKENAINCNFCSNCGKLFNNQQVSNEINQEDNILLNQSNFNPQQSNNQVVEQKQQNNVYKDENGSSKKISGLIIFAFIVAFLILTSFGIVGTVCFGVLLLTYIFFGKANNAYGITLKVIGGISLYITVSILILFGVCFVGFGIMS